MEQNSDSLLEIHDLSVSFRMYDHGMTQTDLCVIRDLHLTVFPGEIVAVAGSSGSGKSLLASAILGILPDNATVHGHLHYKGEELTTQRTKLEEVYQAGKAEMINGYTQLLQDNLGISGDDVQAVKDSFSAILAEKVDAYRGVLEKVHGVISQTGPDSV